MLPMIDTHQHLWDLNQFKVPWLNGVDALNKSFLLQDYVAATSNQNLIGSIYMEVNVESSLIQKEADYVWDLCNDPSHRMLGAVIAAPIGETGFYSFINPYKDVPAIKGVRKVLHNQERGLILQPNFVEHVRYLGRIGKLFDICIRPADLEDAIELVALCPDTQFVLDHCGNADPLIVNGSKAEEIPTSKNTYWHTKQSWLDSMQKLSQYTNVVCKISGIVVRANPQSWTAQDLSAVIDHCINCFGENRIIFGGDWPVCTLTASFEQWAQALIENIKNRPLKLQEKLLSQNAIRIYQLNL